jgi:DNA polymerase III alpha subunit
MFRMAATVRTAGIVTLRQQPDTANGTIFLSLEDEDGATQVIVWQDVRDEQREVLLNARLLAVKGRGGSVTVMYAIRRHPTGGSQPSPFWAPAR